MNFQNKILLQLFIFRIINASECRISLQWEGKQKGRRHTKRIQLPFKIHPILRKAILQRLDQFARRLLHPQCEIHGIRRGSNCYEFGNTEETGRALYIRKHSFESRWALFRQLFEIWKLSMRLLFRWNIGIISGDESFEHDWGCLLSMQILLQIWTINEGMKN